MSDEESSVPISLCAHIIGVVIMLHVIIVRHVWIAHSALVKVVRFTMEQIGIGWSGLCCDVERCCMLMSSKCDKHFKVVLLSIFVWSLDWMNETCSGSRIKVKCMWFWAVWLRLFRLKLSIITTITFWKEVIDYYYCKPIAINYS